MFWDGVAEDIVANLLAAAALSAMTVGVAYWRFSGRLARIRHWIHPIPPDGRVLIATELGVLFSKPERHDPTPFRSPLSRAEREEIVGFYEQLNLTVAYDRPVVRLDGLPPAFAISIVSYLDLVSTNLTAFSANTRLLSTAASMRAMWRWVRIRPLIGKVISSSRISARYPSSIHAVLANAHLANVAAVSVLLADTDGRGLFVRRPTDPTVVSDRWLPTASGTVEVGDASADNPFEAAALRLLREHAGISGVPVELVSVVMPKRRLQPIFAYQGTLAGRWEDLLTQVSEANCLLTPDAELKLIDLTSPVEVVRFCRVAEANETTAFLAWHSSLDRTGEGSLKRAWRHRWIYWLWRRPGDSDAVCL